MLSGARGAGGASAVWSKRSRKSKCSLEQGEQGGKYSLEHGEQGEKVQSGERGAGGASVV